MVRSRANLNCSLDFSSLFLKLTYILGPSFKRGPPKGYINAIEHRLHQVEALLGAIIQSPDARSRGIISDLKTDTIACDIIERVELGPYGPAAHAEASASDSKLADFAGATRTLGGSLSGVARVSRLRREYVSSSLGKSTYLQ